MGNTPSRNFSTPLDLTQSFGEPVDVAEVVQDPKTVEARKNQEASNAAIFGLFQKVYGPSDLHYIFTGIPDLDANVLFRRILDFPKHLQSLLADYETNSQHLPALNPNEPLEQLDSNTISQDMWNHDQRAC